MKELYEQLGISSQVYDFCHEIEESLKERFEQLDKTAEYNQMKVLLAMQKNRVSEECFGSSSGYGYNDYGRDTLEKVYADTFHTEACLVRPQIACGTHALAIALFGNLRPGDEIDVYKRQGYSAGRAWIALYNFISFYGRFQRDRF